MQKVDLRRKTVDIFINIREGRTEKVVREGTNIYSYPRRQFETVEDRTEKVVREGRQY